MSETNTGKKRLKGFRILCVCVVIFVVFGAVYLFNNGFNSAHWPKKAGLGVDIDDVVVSENSMVPASEKDNFKDIEIETFSQVNLLRREYKRGFEDLKVKVPGGEIVNWRLLRSNNWLIGPSLKNMAASSSVKSDLKITKKGNKVAGINWGGVKYSSVDEKTWKYGKEHKITKKDKGYRWENKSREWMDFDESGRMTGYGSASGTLGKLVYEKGANGKIAGIADRKGRQVIWYEYNKEGLVSAIQDKAKRRVEYSYTGEGYLESVTDVMGYKTSFEYDKLGRLVKTTEPNGRESIVTYDEYGDIASNVDGDGIGFFFEFDYDKDTDEYYARVEHSSGKVKEIWYDSNGLTKRKDINGRTVKTVEKDGNDLIITENGHETIEEYDDMDNLIRKINPDGTEVSYGYDKRFNQVTRKIDEAGVVTEFKYNEKGKEIKRIEAFGTKVERVTEYTYDKDGNTISLKSPGDANTLEMKITMTYDEYGNKVSETDQEGNTTYFSYDAMGNILSRTNAKGRVWTSERDAMGREIASIDPLNNVIKTFYDEVGNIKKQVYPNGSEKVFEYDENSQIISESDALGNITLFEYNIAGLLVKISDPEGKSTTLSYDEDDRLVKLTDGNGNEIIREYKEVGTSGCSTCSGGGSSNVSRIIYPTFSKEFTYDDRGRKTEDIDILSDTESYLTEYVYDSRGKVIERIDKEGNSTTYEYDELNQIIKVIDQNNGKTSYTYDNRGNLIALIDAENNKKTFAYDRNNRLVKETRSMGEETTYAYDTVGNLILKIDAKGQKVLYQYDDVDRLLKGFYYNSENHDVPVKVESYAYGREGKLKSYDDGIIIASYEYDKNKRLISEIVNYGSFSKKNTYTYYRNGQRKTFTGPDGITYSYSYDMNNLLASIEIPNKGKVSFNDYIWEKPGTVSLPGGITQKFSYDPMMRIKSITSSIPEGRDKPEELLMDLQYSFDKMDNITAKQTEHGDYKYGYDEQYRLTKAESPMLKTEIFTYDAAGNRLTTSDTTEQWNYNSNNELVTAENSQNSYDANGNMISKSVDGVITHFIYNVENRLSEVRDDSGSLLASYYYNPFGERLWKEVGGVKTYFHYAVEGLVGEYDATGVEIKTYGYKPGSKWTTDPIFMKQGSDYYYYHNDSQGTPQIITDINGAKIWSAKYSSFGKAEVNKSSTLTNNLRFAGQYYDDETGFHYNRYRYYDTTSGRYLTYDPSLSLNPSGKDIPYYLPTFLMDPLQLQGYSYCAGNPVNNIDPHGLGVNWGCVGSCASAKLSDWISSLAWGASICLGGGAAGCTFACLGSVALFPACWAGCVGAVFSWCSLASAGGLTAMLATWAGQCISQCSC